MTIRVFSLAAIIIAFLTCVGCSITRNVAAVQPGVVIDRIYLIDNEDLYMKEFVPEVENQLRELGFDVVMVAEREPSTMRFYMEVTANWAWDMAMYLKYFRATLYDEDNVLGEAEYDSRSGGANMSKLGHNADKVNSLLAELLGNAEPR